LRIPKHFDLAAIGCCALATLAVFGQTRGFEFLNFDDPGYVTNNLEVSSGLTLHSLGWAFTTLSEGHYHPLTWLSHLAVVQVFGLAPGAHHAVNVALHAVNAALLYLALARMTGQSWQALIAALLFAVHPMRAESVAWVTERKDVLSTAFLLGSLLCYVAYARSGGAMRWLGALVCYALGLLAKPMVITLPVLLLLLDHWPLRRSWNPKLLLEKLPFFALAGASAVITWIGQQHAGAMLEPVQHGLGARLANACVAYVAYLGQWIWPSELSIFHPLRAVPAGLGVSSALVLIGLSVAVWRVRDTAPALAIGWCWYVITLVPVIGLVQVGGQAHADRFLYLPSIGIGILLVWGIPALLRMPRDLQLAAISGALLTLGCWAYVQVGAFRNSETVWRHALAVDRDNFMAHNNLGVELNTQGRFAEAEPHLREAVRLNPTYPPARANLGNALARRGDYAGALEHYQIALQRQPAMPETHYNLGLTLARLGRYDEAASHYREALALTPANALAHYSFGALLVGRGEQNEGVAHLRRALALQPGWSEPRAMLERFEAAH